MIRKVYKDGSEWYCASDIIKALQNKVSTNAIKNISENEKFVLSKRYAKVFSFEIPNRGLTFLTETGVVELLFSNEETTKKNSFIDDLKLHKIEQALNNLVEKTEKECAEVMENEVIEEVKNELKVVHEQMVLGKEFKIYGDFENPLFLAKDVAEWIEHNQVARMISLVDDDEKLKCLLSISGQKRSMWFLTEDGLYEVLMQSRKPIAKSFKKQVKEILKTVRKHGVYATAEKIEEILYTPESMIKVFKTIKDEREAKEKAERVIEEMQPKVEYHDNVLNSDEKITLTLIAKDYGKGAIEFNQILNKAGIQFKTGGKWVLYAKYQGKNYMTSKTEFDRYGVPRINYYYTQKGRKMIHEVLKEKFNMLTLDELAKLNK